MPLEGDHQAEDQQLIADMVIARMNHVKPQNPKRPTATQPKQVHDARQSCPTKIKTALCTHIQVKYVVHIIGDKDLFNSICLNN